MNRSSGFLGGAFGGDPRNSGRAGAGRSGSVSDQMVAKLRVRWLPILLIAALGAAAGLMAARGGASYEATTAVQVSIESQDSTRIKQVVQTAERTANSAAVIDQAASNVEVAPDDLALRARAEWEIDTDILKIAVRGNHPRGVVLEANAVAAALRSFYERTIRAELRDLGSLGDDLLTSGELGDPAAEAARRSGVGAAVAARQGAAAYGGTRIILLDPARTSIPTGLSVPVGVVLGGFAGGVLGVVAALLVPLRRYRPRRVSEVATLVPDARVAAGTEDDAAEIAGLFLESERPDLVVIALPGCEEQAEQFAIDVLALLKAHGASAALVRPGHQHARSGVHALVPGSGERDAVDAPAAAGAPAVTDGSATNGAPAASSGLPSYAVLGRSGRSQARRELDADMLVLVTAAAKGPLALLAGQGSVLAVLVARAGRSPIADLQALARRLRHSEPTVVLLP